MFLTIQQLVNGEPVGLQHLVQFENGGLLMQSDYEQIGHGDVRRSNSNKALALSNDEIKFSVRITGSAWQKPGLDGINWRLPVRVGFIEPMAQQTEGGAITPIRTSREDLAPYAHAMTEQGFVETSLDGWEPLEVADALYYIVNYYPVMDGYGRYSGGLDQRSGEYSWSLDFQEK
jgi:hypothetical protein